AARYGTTIVHAVGRVHHRQGTRRPAPRYETLQTPGAVPDCRRTPGRRVCRRYSDSVVRDAPWGHRASSHHASGLAGSAPIVRLRQPRCTTLLCLRGDPPGGHRSPVDALARHTLSRLWPLESPEGPPAVWLGREILGWS